MTPEEGERLDLVGALPGAETEILRFERECYSGGSAELWSVEGADHGPAFNAGFGAVVIDWLMAHPKG